MSDLRPRRMGGWIWWVVASLVLVLPLTVVQGAQPANAQFWKWPWEQEEQNRRQRPRRPAQPPTYNNNNAVQSDPRGRSPVCLQLEQRLAQEANRGGQSRSQIPEINKAIQAARRTARRAERDLDRRQCYEQFLFTRSLRRTQTCVKLDQDARGAERELQQLTARKQQILGQGDRSFQDDIIRELAQNNCGGVYQQEARRRNPFSNFWQDEDSGERNYRGNTFAGLPFATYRTVCVRLCDGFYFPVSFSTLPTHFGRDANVCQSQCAAPVELYFHQNPGQSVEQMVSHRSQQPYTELKSAFRYRKEYVSGCSCKPGEFTPETASAAAGPAVSANPPQFRAGAETNNADQSQRRLSPTR